MQRTNITDNFKNLAFDFFFHYSRFEYALKSNGFLKSSVVDSKAEAGWENFVKKFESCFEPSTDALALIELAPHRQIVGKQGELVWTSPNVGGKLSQLRKVQVYLATARNNLFHGGKNQDGGWGDDVRNCEIVSAATKVLSDLAKLGDFVNDFKCEY